MAPDDSMLEGVTNEELLRRIREVVPAGVRTLTFLRHQSHCAWWNAHGACDCTPVFLIEVYDEVDGTIDDLEPLG